MTGHRTVPVVFDIRSKNLVPLVHVDYGQYPSEIENLKILSEKKYISGIPLDPWKNPYRYRNPGKYGDIDVFSLGADNEVGGEDQDLDFGNWTLTSAEK